MAMDIDLILLLRTVQMTVAQQQISYAQALLASAIRLVTSASQPMLPLFDVGMGLHRGQRRENEDALLAVQGLLPHTHEPFGLFVVCDGMGGHTRGQEAANLALQTLFDYLLLMLDEHDESSNWEAMLAEGIASANRVLVERNVANGATSQTSRMGTTITAAFLIGDAAYIANVGDSRAYLLTPHGLSRITNDHSLVAYYRSKGLIEEEEIYTHPERNKITRALGSTKPIEVDTFMVPFSTEGLLLLCSDGLWSMTRDKTIETLPTSPWENTSAASLADQLVQLALDGGGADNIACLVVQLQKHCVSSERPQASMSPSPFH
jgi:serine/threonine protein phosphatase PrpC